MNDPIISSESEPLVRTRKNFWLFGLRFQLIFPYAALTLIVALGGIFVLTRFVSSSFQERFSNQLLQASRVAADAVVLLEQNHLENLRLMVFTKEVDQAILDADTEKIETLLFPLVFNENIEVLAVVDTQGMEIISFIKETDTEQYRVSSGGDLADMENVDFILSQNIDAVGDKFSEIVETTYGSYLFTSAPVENEAGEFVGLIMIGTSLETFVANLKSVALADIIILDSKGQPSITTLPLGESISEELSLSESETDDFSISMVKDLTIASREYVAYYSPLVLRQNHTGFLAVSLPTNFIVSSTSISRNSLTLIFAIATMAMMLIGFFLARTISRPILHMRDVSLNVASGDFDQRIDLDRSDEIGDLATSFNTMIQNLRQRTRELVQSEKLSAVGQLAAGLAHDVKNPLAVIKGMAEEIQEDIDAGVDEETIKSYLSIIRDNASRANNILTDLMKFSRQSDFELQKQNICESVEKSIRLTDFLARKGGVDIQTDFEVREIMVDFDEQQIEQVLVNLIQNAIHAMSEGGNIIISTSADEGMCEIQVQDTGQGIPPEFLTMIFDPFFTTKSKDEGTGLGLAVAYGIIESHKGTIRVESELDLGTTFFISLPLSKDLEQTEL